MAIMYTKEVGCIFITTSAHEFLAALADAGVSKESFLSIGANCVAAEPLKKVAAQLGVGPKALKALTNEAARKASPDFEAFEKYGGVYLRYGMGRAGSQVLVAAAANYAALEKLIGAKAASQLTFVVVEQGPEERLATVLAEAKRQHAGTRMAIAAAAEDVKATVEASAAQTQHVLGDQIAGADARADKHHTAVKTVLDEMRAEAKADRQDRAELRDLMLQIATPRPAKRPELVTPLPRARAVHVEFPELKDRDEVKGVPAFAGPARAGVALPAGPAEPTEPAEPKSTAVTGAALYQARIATLQPVNRASLDRGDAEHEGLETPPPRGAPPAQPTTTDVLDEDLAGLRLDELDLDGVDLGDVEGVPVFKEEELDHLFDSPATPATPGAPRPALAPVNHAAQPRWGLSAALLAKKRAWADHGPTGNGRLPEPTAEEEARALADVNARGTL
eukprot:CAMPEP_0119271834 /NCGR_PEP_ID=MMETSP1329-20130426/8268_1 /TAXON_ID=114041 /ORGANISM="Genus nov. species nov., Strain RCC1024" /LENGTH=448 /DNA_ID=CAMNT_0007271891 /DNA_START=11 /DNA_END=1357 /DNA_ORIENTATION=-